MINTKCTDCFDKYFCKGDCTVTKNMSTQYTIDEGNSDAETLYVDIKGKGTVVIKSNDDGVSVDIYPMHVVDEPLFTGYVLNSDFDDQGEL